MSRTSFGDQIQQMWHTRPVRLPRQGPIAGVAAGFGLRYGIDPVLLRVAFVVSTIFGGAGIVLYLLAWLVLSSAGNEVSAAEALTDHARGGHSQTKTIVLIVALAIAVSTMGPIGLGLGGSGVVSMGLMLAGWWMLYIRHPELPTGFDTYRAAAYGTGDYPPVGYPTGVPVRGYPYTPDVPPTGMYTPYTKLPDAYVPDPATAAAESTPLLRVDATDTVVLHKNAAAPSSADELETRAIPVQDAAHQTVAPSAASAAASTTAAPAHEGSAIAADDSDRSTDAPVVPDEASATQEAAPTTDAPTEPSSDPASSVHLVKVADAASTSAPVDAESSPAQPAEFTHAAAAAELAAPQSDSSIDLGERSGEPATSVLYKDFPQAGYPRAGAQVPPGIDPLSIAPLAWELPEAAPRYAVAAPPPPKRPRSRLTPVTIGLAILAAAVAGAVAASGVEWMTPARIAAFALAVVGLGLIAGAFLRRGYGLLVLTAPLAGFVLLASLIGPVDFEGRAVGERLWAPTSVTELQPRYALDIGSGTLDLRGLELTESRTVEVAVNIGDAKVLLPEGMTVNTTCDVRVAESGCVDGITGPNTPGAPVLDLRIKMHLGDVAVTRD
ncbi:PspC domain-containing protein [Nocardia neocaledoniensis]|uniref:PspC domain-containing protein n=1 Tax=Nocardia neocaledoniensis TaxID=236511 RepID=UPI002458E0EF|nr:PspC domain-containing protein [Nocardia neocaledoniensis]